MDTKEPTKRTRVRAYSSEFKARVVAECAEPGASVAKVALANGLNTNMIHTWRREARGAAVRTVPGAGEFVPLPLPGAPLPAPATVADIRIELHHGATRMAVTWPATAASECATWMRELLK